MIFESVRSDGKKFNLNNGTWGVLTLDGIGFPDTDVYTKKPAIGDGMIISGKRVCDRTVKVTARSRNAALNEVNRRLAIEFFNPKYTFKNYVTYQGYTYWVDAELEGFKIPSKNIHRPMDLQAQFYSADPYWKSVDNYGKNIAAVTPMFGFPYIQTESIYTIAAAFNFAKQVVIENDGDVETFCTVVISAIGSVINPKIIQGNSYVKVNTTLLAGDVITIDCDKLTVDKNGTNSIALVDKGSSFTDMALVVGDNTISFDADSGDTNMQVYVYYNKKYMGL